jgi:hypothetical protein
MRSNHLITAAVVVAALGVQWKANRPASALRHPSAQVWHAGARDSADPVAGELPQSSPDVAIANAATPPSPASPDRAVHRP